MFDLTYGQSEFWLVDIYKDYVDTGFEIDDIRLFEHRLDIISTVTTMFVGLLTKADKQHDQHD